MGHDDSFPFVRSPRSVHQSDSFVRSLVQLALAEPLSGWLAPPASQHTIRGGGRSHERTSLEPRSFVRWLRSLPLCRSFATRVRSPMTEEKVNERTNEPDAEEEKVFHSLYWMYITYIHTIMYTNVHNIVYSYQKYQVDCVLFLGEIYSRIKREHCIITYKVQEYKVKSTQLNESIQLIQK